MYTLVLRHLSRVHLSRANFLYSHDLSDAQLTWNKVGIIRKCNRDDLNMYEDMFIERFKARIIGLNRSKVSGN